MRLFFNGRIYTQDPANPTASALVIRDDRIIFCGPDQEALRFFPDVEEKIDLEGKAVLPGLCDSHIHLEYYALSLQRVNCETDTLAECLSRVAHKAQKAETGAWILGHGWNQNLWGGQYGTAAQLDDISQGHPVYLTAKSYHAAWVNSKVLELAAINKNTPDPEGGKLSRDEKGNPTGILYESAVNLVKDILPPPSVESSRQAILHAQSVLWQMGITGAHDFDGVTSFAALQELDIHHQLRLRVTKSIPMEKLDAAVEIGLRSGFGSHFLKVGSVKCFADGALGPQTAAMLEPYEQSSDADRGILSLDSEQLLEVGQKATQNGLCVAVHAIGDRANHEVISAYKMLRQYEETNRLPSLRHRVEHVQLLQPEDLQVLAKNRLIASVQPIHATSDIDIANRYWGDRSRFAYAYGSLVNQHIPVCFGSDAPVESPNPFWGLHAAVTRRRHNGYPGDQGWYAEQRLTLAQAIKGYTTGAAFAAGQESCLGQLTSGYFADLIILESDPFDLSIQELWKLKPSATMVAGEWVWTG